MGRIHPGKRDVETGTHLIFLFDIWYFGFSIWVLEFFLYFDTSVAEQLWQGIYKLRFNWEDNPETELRRALNKAHFTLEEIERNEMFVRIFQHELKQNISVLLLHDGNSDKKDTKKIEMH